MQKFSKLLCAMAIVAIAGLSSCSINNDEIDDLHIETPTDQFESDETGGSGGGQNKPPAG